MPLAPVSRKELEEVEHVLKRMKRSRSRFYTDENFLPRAVELLRAMRLDVETASEANRVGVRMRIKHHTQSARDAFSFLATAIFSTVENFR